MPTDPTPAIAAGVVALISGGISWIATRSKSDADVAGELVESSIAMVRELRQDVATLRAQVEATEVEVTECERRYEQLIIRLTEYGLDLKPPEAR